MVIGGWHIDMNGQDCIDFNDVIKFCEVVT
jgi:hypothetical protein